MHGRRTLAPAARRGLLLLLATAALLAAGQSLAFAAAHGASQNVALVPDDGSSSNGGALQTSGTVEGVDAESFDRFAFTDVALDSLDGATLAQYDTVVLSQVQTSDLSDAARQALSAFVLGGGKLIIHDSDGTSGNDYGWLPAPAQTGESCPDCGATDGTAQIVENNSLVSTDAASSAYVDVSELQDATDAIGDANVMVTQDPRWFVDIRATNTLGATGAVHTYASDNGLMIFNGFDTDDMGEAQASGVDWLSKLWYLELAQPWSPDGLPHGTPVAPVVVQPPSRPCAVVRGSIGKRLLAALRCSAIQTKLEAECGFHIAFFVVGPLKALKAAKAASGLYRLSKVPKRLRPVAQMLNDVRRAKINPHGPKGFRTYAQIQKKLDHATTALKFVTLLADLNQAVSKRDYWKLAKDVADFADLSSCIEGMKNAVAP